MKYVYHHTIWLSNNTLDRQGRRGKWNLETLNLSVDYKTLKWQNIHFFQEKSVLYPYNVPGTMIGTV